MQFSESLTPHSRDVDLGKDRVARHAVGALQASSSWSGVAGAVVGALPFGGTVTSLVGLGTVLAARRIEDSSKSRRWYTFGSKLHEISLDAALDRADSPVRARL